MSPSEPPNRLFRAASIIALAYMFSRVMGYARESLLAARFGATHTTDAYLVAQELPNSLFQAVSMGLVMVFIPVYQQVLQRRGADVAGRIFRVVLNATLIGAVLLAALVWFMAPFLIPRLVPGLPDGALELAIRLTRIMLPMIVFLGITGVASAVLNAHRHFTAPALVALVSNLAVVGSLLLVTHPGQIDWVAHAVVAGAALGSVIQMPPLVRLGLRYRPVFDLTDPALAQMGRLAIPVIFTTGAAQLQTFVDRFMASGLAEGSISALSYAQRINTLPYGVVGVAVATVLYPGLAEHAASNRVDELRRIVTEGLRTLAYVLLPMAVGLLVFREPIIQLFFQRGAFDLRAADVTAQALLFLSPGILFFGWLDFLNRSFFALQDAVTPMWAGFVMVAGNVVLNLVFVRAFALGGLALGTSLSAAAAAGVLLWRLRQRVGPIGGAVLARSVTVSIGTSITGALVGHRFYGWLASLLPGNGLAEQTLRLAAGLGAIVAVHVGLGLVLGNRDGIELIARMRQRKETA